MTETGNYGSDGALVDAMRWLEAVLLGSISTAIGVIAIAAFGFLMLTGRIDLRRGFTVVIGFFLVFGAASISSGILDGAAATSISPVPPSSIDPPARLPLAKPTASPTVYDPYAGASVQRP